MFYYVGEGQGPIETTESLCYNQTHNQWTMLQNEVHEFDEVCPWPLRLARLIASTIAPFSQK